MNKKKTRTQKMNIDIDASELDLKKAKAKLSMWVDGDVLEAIRNETETQTGAKKGYQTYLNKKLREVFLHEKTEIDKEWADSVEKRLRILEKAVGS